MKIRSINLLFFSLVYFILLIFYEQEVLTTVYDYMGFKDNYSHLSFYCSVITLVFFFCLINWKNGNDSKIYYIFLAYLLVFIPSLAVFVVFGNVYYYWVSTTSFFIFLLTAQRIHVLPFHLFSISIKSLLRGIFFIVGLYILSIILMGGWRYFNLSIADVYLYRNDAASILPAWYGYFMSPVTSVLIPALVVLSIREKCIFYVCIGLTYSLILFGLLAHKAILFYPLLSMAIYYFLTRKSKKALYRYTVLGLLLIVVISLIDAYLAEVSSHPLFGWFGSLFTRRVIVIPMFLNYQFIEFFTYNEWYYWCSSRVSLGLVSCPYDVSPPLLIGREYYNNAGMSANTGWIGAGFANLGLVGAIIYSFLIGMMVSLISAFSKKISMDVVVPISVLIVINIMTSTDFFTGLISHGGIALFLLYIIIPRSKRQVLGDKTQSSSKGKNE